MVFSTGIICGTINQIRTNILTSIAPFFGRLKLFNLTFTSGAVINKIHERSCGQILVNIFKKDFDVFKNCLERHSGDKASIIDY